MGYGRAESELVKACATAHGVSDRAVRVWREKQDARWVQFLAAKAAARVEAPASGGGAVDPPEDDCEFEPGVGLQFEILRLQRECLATARRIRQTRDLETELTLSRILNEKRESLRRLEKDTPGIHRDAGDSVSRAEAEEAFTRYCVKIRVCLEALGPRIKSLLPQELRADLDDKIDGEITRIQAEASEIRIGGEDEGGA